MNKNLKLLNNQGMSLVEVMIAAGIASIISLAVASMMNSQSKQTKALGEKLGVYELERNLTQILASSTDCAALFAASNLNTPMPIANAAAISFANPFVVKLKSIVIRGQTVATEGGAGSLNTQSLAIKKDGIELNMTSPSAGILKISFDADKLVRPLADLTFPVMITSDWPLSSPAMNIVGCAASKSLQTTPLCATVRYDSPSGSEVNMGFDGRYRCPGTRQLMTSCSTLLYPSGSTTCGSTAGVGIDPNGISYCTTSGCAGVPGQTWATSVTCCSW